jgi:hypothetical protein
MKNLALSIAIALMLVGCATQTFQINPTSTGSVSTTKEDRQAFFVSGLGQTQTMNAAEICGGANKIIKVEAEHTFIDGLLGCLTWGIYTPRMARVYCAR